MKKMIAFNGSPRKSGNSVHMLEHFFKGAHVHTHQTEQIDTHYLEIEFCRGCLRCNVLGRCSIQNDRWPEISEKISTADVLVFASPIYFHHLTAQLKKVLDRFRSFLQVQLNEASLTHTPRGKWNKDFVLLLSMGSSDVADAQPVVDLFHFISSTLGDQNKVHVIKGTRLAVAGQISKSETVLRSLYPKLNLSENLASQDYYKNRQLLEQCYQLGDQLGKE